MRQRILSRDTERLVSAARVFLAISGGIAHYFDPRGGLDPGFSALILVYGLIGVAVLTTHSGIGRPQLAKAIHAMDLGFATIMILSPSGASYFLILTTFCLLSSVIQWRWQITLLTGAYLLSVYLLAVTSGLVGAERVTIRTAFLVLAPLGTALASRSALESRKRLLKLAHWSSSRYSANDDAVLRVFRHAADVMEAGEICVFYHEVDASTAIKSTYNAASDRLESTHCETWPEDTTSAALRNQPFLVVDPDRQLCLTYSGMKRMPDATPGLSLSSCAGIVASAPFTGDFCSGRLFACGINSWRWEQMVLVEIVAAHVRSRLEGRIIRDRTGRMTAELERMRLSRDLHDGILQSLTAARLHLNALAKEAPDLSARIALIGDMLQDEQQKLREFVEDSRSGSAERVSITRIAERIRSVAEHWRLQAAIDIECAEAEVPEALYREVYFIIGEAIANAVRHGRATSISARLSCTPRTFVLLLNELDGAASDDGDTHFAPRSIDGRIRDLGGSLYISSGQRGVSLKVELPIHD